MRALFRCDASATIGVGHVMRCLTLAQGLMDIGWVCEFAYREIPEGLIKILTNRGLILHKIPIDFRVKGKDLKTLDIQDWSNESIVCEAKFIMNLFQAHQYDLLVVDHYQIDCSWEGSVKQSGVKILVIDDLANKVHRCDLLLNQNLGAKASDYQNLVPHSCKKLIGERYALIRKEFLQYREYSFRRRGSSINKILVSLGGGDNAAVALNILKALESYNFQKVIKILVLMGFEGKYESDIDQYSRKMSLDVQILDVTDEISLIMAESDLCIGAGGSTAWERCALGLPAITVLTAENQLQGAKALNESGCTWLIESQDNLQEKIHSGLSFFLDKSNLLSASVKGFNLIDCKGVDRVIKSISTTCKEACHLRPMRSDDLEMVLAWRNSPSIRKVMKNQKEISFEEHKTWFALSIKSNKKLFIFQVNEVPKGFVQFEIKDGSAEWGFYVDPKCKGAGKKMGITAINYAFDNFDIQCITGDVLKNNDRSHTFHLFLGFKINNEGSAIKNNYLWEGELVTYKINKGEWLEGA